MAYIQIRKRRESALTNYKRRIALLKGHMPRVVVRKSNSAISMQIIQYQPDGDKILSSANSVELKKLNWPSRANLPTAYLTGLLLAKKATSSSIKGALILDIGLYKPVKNSVVFAAAKGAIDGGLEIKSNIVMDQKRISGEHISEYAKKLDKPTMQKIFSDYIKQNIDPANIDKVFEEVRKKITIE